MLPRKNALLLESLQSVVQRLFFVSDHCARAAAHNFEELSPDILVRLDRLIVGDDYPID